jgi:WD40 repeat protein
MQDQATRLRITFLALTAVAVVCGANACFAQRPVTLRGQIGDVQHVCFSPEGKYVTSVVPHDSVKVWNVESGTVIVSLGDRQGDAFHSAAFSPDGTLLAACGQCDVDSDHGRGVVTLWETNTWQTERIFEKPTRGDLSHVVFLPTGKTILAGAGSPAADYFLWDVASGNVAGETAVTHLPQMEPLLEFGLTPDGRSLILAELIANQHDARGNWHPTSRIVALDIGSDSTQTLLSEVPGSVVCAAASPDGYRFVAGGGSDSYRRTRPGMLVLWDQNGAATSLTGHQGTVLAATFSTDGRLMASGGKDRIIRLWDVKAATMIRQLRGHRGDVQALAFSPDGRLLASGGEDRRVYLWPIDD